MIFYQDDQITLIRGDALDILKELPENSIDSIVTDPPYGLKFMGKDWDHGIPGIPFWVEALRVAKPGAHLLAFGGDRTHHRLMVAIEDAGWEIRTCVYWVFGSGFPKSLNIAKSIQKEQGIPLEDTGIISPISRPNVNEDLYKSGKVGKNFTFKNVSTEAAKQWDGSGTALKPAVEIVVMARKPLSKPTVAANVLRWGTEGINIDGCRIGTKTELHSQSKESAKHKGIYGEYSGLETQILNKGRFPANLIHDGSDEVVNMFPETSSGKPGIMRKGRNDGAAYGQESRPAGTEMTGFGDTGSAARFFYCAKASKADRDEGCEGIPEKTLLWSSRTKNPGSFQSPNTNREFHNYHPTVKPTTLMQYLCRLITPTDGTVLDMLAGSGSTGKGAILEGFKFIGIERELEYCEISKARLEYVQKNIKELLNQTSLDL